MRVSRFFIVIAFAAVVMSGCEDSKVPTAVPPEPADALLMETQTSDIVYWQGNTLTLDVDGQTHRIQRDQQDATRAWLYVNGVLRATVDVQRAGGEIVGYRFRDAATPGTWAELDPEGVFTSTNLGCIPGPDNPNCGPYMPNFGVLSAPCANHFIAAVGYGAGTMGGALGFAATLKFPGFAPFSKPLAVATIGSAVMFVNTSAQYIACLSQGGGSDCDPQVNQCKEQEI